MRGSLSRQPCPPQTSIIAARLGHSQPSGLGINQEKIRDSPVPGPSPWGGEKPANPIVIGLVSILCFLQAMQSVSSTDISSAAKRVAI